MDHFTRTVPVGKSVTSPFWERLPRDRGVPCEEVVKKLPRDRGVPCEEAPYKHGEERLPRDRGVSLAKRLSRDRGVSLAKRLPRDRGVRYEEAP